MNDSNLFLESTDKSSVAVKRNYYKSFAKEVLKKPSFIIPTIILIVLFITGFVLCNFINVESELVINMDKKYLSPSFRYPLGTNAFGQNQFYIILIGTYKTLLLAIVATFINIIIGIIVGSLWGTSKKVDSFMFIFKNLVDNTPLIFFYVIIVLLLGDGFIPLLIVVTLFGWLEIAYLIRNNLLLIKSKDYNKVSRLYKVPLRKIVINNYLPSILPILFNSIAISIPKMIALEITIFYFGFSFGNGNPSLGTLLYTAISYNTYFIYPHIFFIPFAFLTTINLCSYFISKTISNSSSKEVI